MEKLCRFCLKVSNENVYNLQESDILFNIRTFLTLKISTDDSFPNNLCKECFKIISQIIEFCLTVNKNEEKLQQHLNDDSLQDYYLKLTNNMQIKEEGNAYFMLYSDSKYVKVEDYNINKVSEINKTIDKEKDNNDFDGGETFKHEESAYDSDKTHCSSEDEITLSSVKKVKEFNTNIPKEMPEKISKIKTQKNIKRKKTSEPEKNPEKKKATEPRKDPKRKKTSDPQLNLKIKKTNGPQENLKNEPQQISDLNTNMNNLKQFTCLTCFKQCDSQTSLINHYYEDHFHKDTDNIKYTKNELDGKITYSCDSCENTCYSKKNILKHVASHNDERHLICKLCARMYKTVSDIIRHARVHNDLRLHCSYKCGYTTAYQGHLKEHESRHVSGYKYKCEKCGKGFPVRTWYEQHQNIHKGVKPFVCDICGLAFHMARYLSTHKNSMHPQSSSVKRYICIHCNQKCGSVKSLAIHLEEHGINRENGFLCDYCGKILSTAYQLKYHHRMHLGVKPYSCNICNKTFAKKFNVVLHMTIHSGEKPHSCAQCGKRYSQRSTLLKHLKTQHGGTSPKRTEIKIPCANN